MEKSCCEPKYILPLHIRLLIIAGAILLRYLLSLSDLTSLLGSTEISDNLRVIVLLGLVASVSTCLAITGGIIVGYTELVTTENSLKTQIWLHLGRVIGFVLFGGILGLLGEQISYSLGFSAWLNLAISGLLLVLAFQILGLLPKWKWNHSGLQSLQSRIEQYSQYSRCSALIGGLTFFIPCGFTQMVQIMALASGSLLSGSLMMGVFALGTLPGLALLSAGTAYAKISHKRKFEGIVALVLIAFSLYSIQGSASLLGFNDAMSRTGDSTYTGTSTGEVQKIALVHNGLHLVPEDLVLESGKDYEITITPNENGIGCMSSIALPSIDKEVHPIVEGEKIIYFLENPSPGTYTFVCSSMGMSQGKIIVK